VPRQAAAREADKVYKQGNPSPSCPAGTDTSTTRTAKLLDRVTGVTSVKHIAIRVSAGIS